MNNVINKNSQLYFGDLFSSEKFISLCKIEMSCVVVLTDNHVGSLYEKKILAHLKNNGIVVHLISIPAGEVSKTRETKLEIENKMFSLRCGRDTMMIALGGGVVTDLAGFVAATYCRGIPIIYIPTSLLCMVDASIGGKTGVNTSFGKNTVGTFTKPKAIFTDISFLVSLPEEEYLSAASEIIKHALIYDLDYFLFLENNLDKFFSRDLVFLEQIIIRSCEIKEDIVADDEKEIGKREILNYGHTIAHALEMACDYKLSHGSAVAYGLIAESFIANKIGFLPDSEFKRILFIISKILCKLNKKIAVSVDKVISALKYDKKNRNRRIRFVILQNIGLVFTENNSFAHPIADSIIQESIQFIIKN
ncbi:MAG: 3-dehydroquinate synthase [Legionellales bacterium RIFCSPHIGHO2_12_FULL_35_11]|nr:MAG: 3-dehydroquinate synthase [Legionellales bacterium RIFCSPHIGHO2_12_FULL_35_11]